MEVCGEGGSVPGKDGERMKMGKKDYVSKFYVKKTKKEVYLLNRGK